MNHCRTLRLLQRGTLRSLLSLMSCVGLAFFAPTAVSAAPMRAFTDAGLRRAVESVLPVARRKLMSVDCRRIFFEFQDRSGKPLQRKLNALRETPADNIMQLVLLDGSGRVCRRPGVLALSEPGSRVVHLCRTRFQAAARLSPGYAANILIHEQLHALGLEEDPPSSEEITHRVALRCGW